MAWDSSTDSWLQPQADLPVDSADGSFSIALDRDCVYTLTTTRGQKRPVDGSISKKMPEPAAFKLPYKTTFDNGPLDGGEAYFLGDQMGKWEATIITEEQEDDEEAVEHGVAMRQIVTDDNFAIAGQSNADRLKNNVPLTIIGDLFMEDLRIETEFMIESKDERTAMGQESYAGVALRVTAAGWPFRGNSDSPILPGLFLKVYSSGRWTLCAEANCTRTTLSSAPVDFEIKSGKIPAASAAKVLQKWHKLSLSVLGSSASASFDGASLFESVDVLGERGLHPSDHNARAGAGWAALTSSFSGVLFDNLALVGAHMENSSTVRPSTATVASGADVGSLACGAPSAINGWHVDAATGLVHVRSTTGAETDADSNGSSLCLTAELAPPPSPGDSSCAGFINTTGGCAGLTHAPSGDHSATACAAACCGDAQCGTWQYLDGKDNPSPKGNCWVGTCAALHNDTSCGANKHAACPWVTGWRKTQPSGHWLPVKEEGRVLLGTCNSAAAHALRFDPHTGRIILATSSSSSSLSSPPSNSSEICVGIRPKQGASTGAAPAAAVLQPCQPLPCDFQQFQVNQPSGAIRHKAGFCVEPCTGPAFYNGICAGGASVTQQGWPAFRDCCLSVGTPSASLKTDDDNKQGRGHVGRWSVRPQFTPGCECGALSSDEIGIDYTRNFCCGAYPGCPAEAITPIVPVEGLPNYTKGDGRRDHHHVVDGPLLGNGNIGVVVGTYSGEYWCISLMI